MPRLNVMFLDNMEISLFSYKFSPFSSYFSQSYRLGKIL